MQKPLRVGLIGTGYMGKCHALAWNAVAPVFGGIARPELAFLAEADAELAHRRARELGFAHSTGDWRALVNDPDIDIVSITTPNQFHPEMAIAALKAGKHVWCEKPMAPALADARSMAAAAAASGKVAALGYNYIQNPVIRFLGGEIAAGRIGKVNHIRVEMDEDFMADASTPFGWKHAATSGYGALDDFGVHPLSLIFVLFGPVARVFGHMARPYRDRAMPDGSRRPVETHDIATMLFEMDDGISGTIQLNRSAWGRKGRIALQIFGSAGSIIYDQERFNEIQIYEANGPAAGQGFRTILAGPAHPPYDRFIPAPGHGLGFNDLKIIECRELMHAIADEPARLITFADGLHLEAAVHATARSHNEGRWIDVVV